MRRSWSWTGTTPFSNQTGGDWVSVAVYGSDADRNDRFPLGFGQLLIIERDNNNSHTPTPTPTREKLSTPSVPEPPCHFLINCGDAVIQRTQLRKLRLQF